MNTKVTIYPNPFASSLSFEVIVEIQASTIVRMLDDQQKIIKMMNWNLKKGTNKTSFDDLDELPSGSYYVDIKNMDGKNLFDAKLVKM